MAHARTDRRVEKTRQALRSALLDLMAEHGYESVNVQDILDRAEVGRATFYQHYRGKDDLLRRSFEPLRAHLIQQARLNSGGEPGSGAWPSFSLAFFRHVASHRRLYRAVVGRQSGAIVDREMRRMLTDLVKEEARGSSGMGQNKTRIELVAQYIIGAMMSVATWWLDGNVNLSPEELDGIFQRMTLPALDAIREA